MGLAILAVALVANVQDGATDQVVRVGDHFRLVCHFDDEAVAGQALEAVEAVWPSASELYGLDAPEEPYEVHLYRDAQAFNAVDQELTGGNFERNQAFAHFDTMTAHVALQPPLSNASLERLGLPQQTLRLLAHEAAHVLRYATMPNFRSHPEWFVHGTASWLDRRALEELGRYGERAEHPESSTSILRLRKLLDDDALPDVASIVSDAYQGELDFHQRYRITWAFFEFLAETHGDELREVVAAVRQRDGGTGFAEGVHEDFERAFGRKAKKLDAAFARWLGKLEPAWDVVIRALEPPRTDGTAGFRSMAFPTSNAVVWRARPVAKRKYSISGEVELLLDGNTQLNLLLGRSDDGFVSIAFSNGRVTIFHYASKTNAWNRLAQHDTEAIGLGERTPFTVRVSGKKLTLELPGDQVVTVDDVGHDLRGPWGLGAQAGSAGLWHELEAPGL